MDWEKVRHFKPEEFDDPDHPGSGQRMNPETIWHLDDLREETGWPIITHNKNGLRGCVCIDPRGHSENSYHYVTNIHGASAVDFHFKTAVHPRDQAMAILGAGFRGVGVYQDSRTLPVWFHVDLRPWPQIWTRAAGRYVYLLK